MGNINCAPPPSVSTPHTLVLRCNGTDAPMEISVLFSESDQRSIDDLYSAASSRLEAVAALNFKNKWLNHRFQILDSTNQYMAHAFTVRNPDTGCVVVVLLTGENDNDFLFLSGKQLNLQTATTILMNHVLGLLKPRVAPLTLVEFPTILAPRTHVYHLTRTRKTYTKATNAGNWIFQWEHIAVVRKRLLRWDKEPSPLQNAAHHIIQKNMNRVVGDIDYNSEIANNPNELGVTHGRDRILLIGVDTIDVSREFSDKVFQFLYRTDETDSLILYRIGTTDFTFKDATDYANDAYEKFLTRSPFLSNVWSPQTTGVTMGIPKR